MLKMMKDSGEMWDAFQVVGDRLGVKVLRYTKVTETRFQVHVVHAIICRECCGTGFGR